VWNRASSASAREAAPGVLSNSSWACLSNAQWISRCPRRAGVTVGALEAKVNDDSNSLHLQLWDHRVNCGVSFDLIPCCDFDVDRSSSGAFGSPLPVGMLSRKIF